VDFDRSVRIAAFNWLSEQIKNFSDDVLHRSLLASGFEYNGKRVPLVAPQGIFKPKILDYPLTITSVPTSDYNDVINSENSILYKYRGKDYSHRDNVGLRMVMEKRLPLIYLIGMVPGKYFVTWPVYIIADNPMNLTFTALIDQKSIDMTSNDDNMIVSEGLEARQRYQTAIVKKRLHQSSFREKVIHAYKSQCTICKIKYRELLDAAHIIPDKEPDSRPIIKNGLSLCKIHHAAYDRNILGISPDYLIKIRADLLEEIDGPMLQYGFKELHNNNIILPGNNLDWPDKDLLDSRFNQFKNAI